MTLFAEGKNCWKVAKAERFAVIVDAADYFKAARAAMLLAERRIMLIGWDFDARIRLRGEPLEPGEPETVGAFIRWLADRRPSLEIYLLRWDIGALKTLVRGTNIFTAVKWARHTRIHPRLDRIHPPGASHHQKIVAIDDCFAFCGGIDMTDDRWDTREHLDDQPERLDPGGKAYGPWHDATSAIDGPAAAALGELARARWRCSGGAKLEPIEGRSDCWPPGLEAQFENVDVAISRSIPAMPDQQPVTEIEQLYLDLIASAKRTIYAESQYFASRRIAEAFGKRLAEPDGPEIVLINPTTADGWLEPIAMDTARARLVTALRSLDPHKRLRLYHAFTAGGAPIYVHAKIMVIDDVVLRIGSSNMNNRSLRLDTECDVTIDRSRHDAPRLGDNILAVRDGLIAEHLGLDPEIVTARIAREGSVIAAIEQLRGPGRSLRPYQIPDLNEVEKWLADNEVLDPEGPGEMFESPTKRGLFKGWLGRSR